MAKFPTSFHNHASVSSISAVLQSSQITNDKQSSCIQIKSVARKSGKLSISGEGERVDSCRVPAHLLTPLSSTNEFEGRIHDDSKQHSLDFGQTDNFASSTDYQHSNRRLKFEEENKTNSKIPNFNSF